ncbi:DUF1211 domain-containing protein [Nodosilinea sp. LEGE 07088]|uniref:TMEM175 family protein n=1 Tax=Nodosilinea sp. LEGE 07088 TaxID=2777968 RepID=UPI0018810490|nr:TMEM175 family protein [Nodosilinea sp. LEGE 07088]MBE9140674.1 DUF1211 domain-containing protein [Nodosilinea sp. LEGE 07088]
MEAFSDGVFAIVITLLVLEIHVPEISSELAQTELPHQLMALLPKVISYITSFLMIGIYWVAHHNLFRLLQRCDRALLWLNLIFLMCLAFIPFPTALIGEYAQSTLAVALYGGVLLVSAIAFNLMWWYVSHHYRLLDRSIAPHLVRTMTRDYLAGIGLYAFAFFLAFLNAHISIAIYLLTPILFIFFNSRSTANIVIPSEP